VDKILKGARPAELPVEQLSEYDLIVDPRTKRALDLKVPGDLLLRTHEVS
jgi:putative ABC transport system substrate-binding protein